MKAVIIEDEEVAAQALALLFEELYPDVTVLATLQSVDDSVEWLQTHPAPDLLFMDIHLSDDSSFSIFDRAPVLLAGVRQGQAGAAGRKGRQHVVWQQAGGKSHRSRSRKNLREQSPRKGI
jgi:hypothetical protein